MLLHFKPLSSGRLSVRLRPSLLGSCQRSVSSFDRPITRALINENLQANEYGELPENESKFFAKVALPEIVPVLLTLLTRQEEDADEEEWNVSMAAGTCLGLLATAVADTIVPAVIPFIEANIRAQDWHQREAAVMAFGSILDGPDPAVLTPLVNQALPILIDMMTDSVVAVKDTVSWTLGRICDLLVNTIKPEVHLHPPVSTLVNGLQDNPRIATNCCWALINLSDQMSYTEEGAPQPSPLSPYYEGIVQALLRSTETYVLFGKTCLYAPRLLTMRLQRY